jgi:hypothetical protein
MKMIFTFWLLLLGGIFGFPVPNTEARGSTLTLCYDARNQGQIGYDWHFSHPLSSNSAYDGTSVLPACESLIRHSDNLSILANFPHFVAAEGVAAPTGRFYSTAFQTTLESGSDHE